MRPAATSAIALLAVMSPVLGASIGRIDSFETRVLAAHNRERAASDIAALQWDSNLVVDARNWGIELSKTGTLKHADDRPGEAQGENLWAGTRGHYGIESMIGLWTAERSDYKPGVFPANSRSGDLAQVGHYTQLMWRSTARVGCALVAGESDEFLVCRYTQAGNVTGERPF